MHFRLITWMSKKTLLILNSRNVLFSVTHTHKNTRTQPHKHLMWSQWGRRAAFSRCFFLIPICAHWRKQIIDTWVLGSDASSELINVSLIVAVVHCARFVSPSIHMHVLHVWVWMSTHDVRLQTALNAADDGAICNTVQFTKWQLPSMYSCSP